MKLTITAGLVLAFALSGCSSKQPDWVDQPAGQYPQQDFLSAVGEADNRSGANDRALANLAKIFEVAVSDRSLDFAQAQVSVDQAERSVNNIQTASRFVTTEAKQVLEGAQLVENWQDESGKSYALAVLEKAPAARRFRDALRAADRQIADRVDFASQQAPNPVVALAALEQARQTETRRSNLNRNLAVVSGKGIRAAHDQASLEKLLRNALARLRFSVATDSAELTQNLESAVSALGIRLDNQTPYRLAAVMDTEPVKQQQGWYWLRGSIQLSLEYQGDTLAKKRWPLKVSAMDQGMVEQRAKDKLSEQMTAYLYELITSVE